MRYPCLVTLEHLLLHHPLFLELLPSHSFDSTPFLKEEGRLHMQYFMLKKPDFDQDPVSAAGTGIITYYAREEEEKAG